MSLSFILALAEEAVWDHLLHLPTASSHQERFVELWKFTSVKSDLRPVSDVCVLSKSPAEQSFIFYIQPKCRSLVSLSQRERAQHCY